jgi:hypothetical protein
MLTATRLYCFPSSLSHAEHPSEAAGALEAGTPPPPGNPPSQLTEIIMSLRRRVPMVSSDVQRGPTCE